MYEELIPIVMFAVIGIVLGLFYYFRYRTRTEMQRTVRTALERGQELSPELIDRLGEPRYSPVSDLRRGMIAVALALALGIFGFVLDEQEAIRPLIATAMLPLFIGIAYLVLWRLKAGKDAN